MSDRKSTGTSAGTSRTKIAAASKQTAPIRADPTAVIYDTATLVGSHPITIGAHSVIHPRATIYSHAGPVTVGDYCIVCERSVVGFPKPDSQVSPGSVNTDGAPEGESQSLDISPVVIGNHVSVEPFAQVMGSLVGDGCMLEVYSIIGKGAKLGKHCHVGTRCEVLPGVELGENAVLYWLGIMQRRRYNNTGLFELEKINQEKHCQVLKQLWQASRKGKG